MNYLIHATPVHPSLCLQYLVLLLTIATITTFILLLLLPFHYYHHYKTVATDKPLRASLFLGAVELTTHLLRLINILWLPLCRINKFGFYFPRRLLWSPILVGHQKYSRNWMKQKPNLLFFSKHHKVRRWDGGGPGARLTLGWRGLPLARATRGVRPAGPPPDAALSPIYSPPQEKPKERIAFPQNILQATTVIVARSGGSRSSSRHPAGEGNPYRRPSPPSWSPPE
jgi:hypothetical protein